MKFWHGQQISHLIGTLLTRWTRTDRPPCAFSSLSPVVSPGMGEDCCTVNACECR